MDPLKEPWSSEVGDPRSSEARSDECLEDCGPRELNLSYFMTSGGSWEDQIPRRCETGWVRLKNLGLRSSGTRIPGLESLEARIEECLEDCGPRELNVSYSLMSGGSWERQIPTT